jgi:hypothetical protein
LTDSAPETEPVPSTRFGRLRQACVRFLLQACVWFLLSLAIAAMLVVGQPFEFGNALRFSTANWMPWALITPIVFWTSGRFPIVRGHLVRSIPIHLVVGLVCTIAVAWITLQLPFAFGPLLSISGDARAGAQRTDRIVHFNPGPGFPAGFGAGTVAGGEFVVRSQGSSLLAGPFGPGGPPVSVNHTMNAATFQVQGPVPSVAPPSLDPVPPPEATGAGPSPGPTFTVPVNGGFVVRGGMPAMASGAVTVANGAGLVGFAPGIALRPFEPTWQMRLMPLVIRANAGIAVYLIIASAAHAMAFYRQAQERERQSLALVASRNQAKLDALRLQLQPHFLFNTLNAISTLVHRDPDAADNLIGDLSDLLRVSLQTTAHEVTLARELELLDHYLAIEQARLGDRLRIRREIDPAALGAFVPTLILQPLAENAVRHGIEPRLAPGTITLRARREGGVLRLAVADDGVGFNPAASVARRGIGLANSEERLRTLHGDRAQLEVVTPPAGGVRVEIALPFRTEPTAATSAAAGA